MWPFTKKLRDPEAPSRPMTAPAHSGDRVRDYFGGVIQVREMATRLQTELTDKGQKKLGKMTKPELLLYMATVTEAHKIQILYNLAGTGPVCSASDFLAFQGLMGWISNYLTMKEDTPPEEPKPKDRYEIATERTGESS